MTVAGRKRPARGYLPSPAQVLLLRAALAEGDEAANAWREWNVSADIDHLDYPSLRLLPLVYPNLSASDVPHLGKLKGLHRRTWYENQFLLRVVAERLKAFHEAGIETLVLKGVALVSGGYMDAGSRPMQDFDVLVRADQARRAMGVLRESGWRPKELASPEISIPVRNAQPFVDGEGRECDLHWHVLHECCQAGTDDEDFWGPSAQSEVGGVGTRILGPTEQLLHACIHGARWEGHVPNVRWIADAVKIATSSRHTIDWPRLVALSDAYRLTLPLREALGYLRDEWHVTVPPAIMRRLEEAHVSYAERIEHAARTRPPSLPWVTLSHWAHNERLAGEVGVRRQLARFPTYLRQFWALEHTRQVPFHAGRVAGRRAKRLIPLPGKLADRHAASN